MNDLGQVAFHALLPDDSGSGTVHEGIFSGTAIASLETVTRTGEPTSNGAGTFARLYGNSQNQAGEVAFLSLLDVTGGDAEGIFYRNTNGSIVEVVRSGQATPGGKDTFSYFSIPQLNDSGQVAFFSGLNLTGGAGPIEEGIFRANGFGSSLKIMRRGDAAPGGNGHFREVDRFLMNNRGEVAFHSTISETAGASSDNSGVFLSNGAGGVKQIARKGQSTPDGNGIVFGFGNFALNDSGQVAFEGYLTDTRGADVDNRGVFRGDGTGISQIVRSGESSSSGNGVFSGFNSVVMNNDGQVVFRASVLDGNRVGSGVFRSDALNSHVLIARDGMSAPDGNGTFSNFCDANLAENGHVVFSGYLTGTNEGLSDDHGLYHHHDRLGLTKVAREGDWLLGSTITNIKVGGVNALGQVTYQFSLSDDRQGIAIATVLPEPNSLLILLLASLAVVTWRRR